MRLKKNMFQAFRRFVGRPIQIVDLNEQALPVSDVPPQLVSHANAEPVIAANSLRHETSLLDLTRTQWLTGEWESLTQLTPEILEHHPERAGLALVVGAAWQQLNDNITARKFIELARRWGADQELMARVLVAGLHNTLGRAAAINGNDTRALEHFRSATLGGGAEQHQLYQARCFHEQSQLRAAIARIDKRDSTIFIHSLWRAGSTYVFNTFRRENNHYWAYQEPLHEIAVRASETTPQIFDDISSATLAYLRHPVLDLPYFYELGKTYTAWRGLISKPMILESYFGGTEDSKVVAYFQSLISSAPRRAVIQECRTSQRIGMLKGAMGGIHIYLVRNPWDQWYSYFTHANFLATLQIILNANNLPPILSELREIIGHKSFSGNSVESELRHYCENPLTAEHSYFTFFLLWALAYISGRKDANLLIDMDEMTQSNDYRLTINKKMQELGIDDVDFSDCEMPRSKYLKSDINFFEDIEDRSMRMLHAWGYAADDLDSIRGKLNDYKNQEISLSSDAAVAGLARLRSIITSKQRLVI